MSAIRKINSLISEWGYAHTKAGQFSDSEINYMDLLVHRGLAIDTIYPNTKDGQRQLANSNKRKSTSKR